MPLADGADAQLATFDATLADAVVSVLRREGVPADVEPADDTQMTVIVPGERREEALILLARHMEAIRELAAGDAHGEADSSPSPASPTAGSASAEGDDTDDGPHRPLLLERVRRVGFGVAILLVPLLAITVAGRYLPAAYALVLFVGGLVALTWWRNRRDRGSSPGVWSDAG